MFLLCFLICHICDATKDYTSANGMISLGDSESKTQKFSQNGEESKTVPLMLRSFTRSPGSPDVSNWLATIGKRSPPQFDLTNWPQILFIASNEMRIIANPKRMQAWWSMKTYWELGRHNWKIMEDSSMETRHSHGSRGRCGNLGSNTCSTLEHIRHIPGCNFKTRWTTISAACHSIQHRWRPASSLLSTTRNSLGKSVQNWYLKAKAKSHDDIDKVHPARVWSHDSIYGQPDVWFDFHVTMDVSQICHWRWKQNMSRGACCAVPKVDSPQTNPEQLAHRLRGLYRSEWPRATRRMSSRFPGQPSTLKAPFEGRKISLVSLTIQYPCKFLAIAPAGSRILIVAYYLFL